VIITAWLAASSDFFMGVLFLQGVGFVIGMAGLASRSKTLLSKLTIIPGYLLLMNAAAYAGLLRHLQRSQSVVWEKAQRQSTTLSI
jgi:hypothetical protein